MTIVKQHSKEMIKQTKVFMKSEFFFCKLMVFNEQKQKVLLLNYLIDFFFIKIDS